MQQSVTLPPPPAQAAVPTPGVYQYVGAWLLFFMMLFMMSKTSVGKVILYYLMWSLVILLLVTHYKDIQTLFTGIVTP